MKELTIGEVAHCAGIETSAIRYYESVGLLPPPKRVNGRNRRYDPTILKRLGLIQLLRDAGFGIKALQALLSPLDTGVPASPPWQTLVAAKIAEMDALIVRTQTTKTWLVEALGRECKGIDECIQITIDETKGEMQVTLSCEISVNHASRPSKAITLLTMQPLPDLLNL